MLHLLACIGQGVTVFHTPPDVSVPVPHSAGASSSTWYLDVDGDGFGNPATPRTAAHKPAGYVADATDCDDGDPRVYPGGAERCRGGDGTLRGDAGWTEVP